jgi:hypothetical protein
MFLVNLTWIKLPNGLSALAGKFESAGRRFSAAELFQAVSKEVAQT